VYAYTAGALAISAVSAVACVKMGFTATLLSIAVGSPYITGIAFLAVGAGLIAATILTPNENSLLKHGCYGLFAVAQGLVLSPLVLINAGAFATATAATVALTGGLGALAMNLQASFEKYEKILMVGLGAIALASLGALVLPASAAALAHQISYVGGFALFGAFVIYDTHVARSEANRPDFVPINHAMNIYLDALNLLVRLWEFFSGNNSGG
jgi:FtsH-binding integral membrane protein